MIKRKVITLLVLVLVMYSLTLGQGPVILRDPQFPPSVPQVRAITQDFTSSGSWQAPAGVTSVTIEAWGAGGAGGGRGSSSGVSGGGGGGAYATRTITVTPLNSYSYTVGTGGTGGTGAGTAGTNTVWGDGSQVKAAGGKGGTQTTTKGLGGTVADSVGATTYKGGDGADGSGSVGGGGGSGAGSTGAGNNASGQTAGGAKTENGGAGGNGGANSDGGIASLYGGGGGGAHRSNGNRRGGDGANGLLRITYNTPPSFTVTPSDTPDPVVQGSSVTFSATATDSESNNWYLVICKTDFVTAGAPPSCDTSQTYCVSSSAVASDSQNTCSWSASGTGDQNWYAFACDAADTNPLCSSASTTNSPITVNQPTVVSVTITSDGTVNYGTLVSGETISTLDLSDTQTAQNDGNVAADFNIKTSTPAGWTLSSVTGNDAFVHEFSTNSGSNWTKFSLDNSYQTLVSNVADSNSQNFDLRFTAPTPSTTASQKSITITVQAVQH